MIAEEVAEVFPELVVINDQGQPETVKYRLLSALLLNEVQRQEDTIQTQADKIRQQEQGMQSFQRQLDDLHTLVQASRD